jgi:hypothetical protein
MEAFCDKEVYCCVLKKRHIHHDSKCAADQRKYPFFVGRVLILNELKSPQKRVVRFTSTEQIKQ